MHGDGFLSWMEVGPIDAYSFCYMVYLERME